MRFPWPGFGFLMAVVALVTTATTTEVDQNWYGRARSALARSEYEIRYRPNAAAYQSPNRAHNLRVTYHHDGFSLEPRGEGARSWSMSLRLHSIGRKDASSCMTPGTHVTREVEGGRMVVHHGGFDIQYHNGPEGMRQDFVVHERTPGPGPLLLTLRYEGTLTAVSKSGTDVLFAEEDVLSGGLTGRVWYKDLRVWDRTGRQLDAAMEVAEDGAAIQLVVNDRDAAYPITVDPLSTTADWTAESNQDSAGFGTSVASAGDVNGDGFSDVIVGAPGFDVDSVDQGRVFLFLGSATGPSTSPDWSATISRKDLRFGVSVASAGDVNGDGYSDVIVGASRYDSSGSIQNNGIACAYLGSPAGLSADYSWAVTGDVSNAQFGVSLANAGDVNGDGYSDVIVGAQGYQANKGRAYVFHGSDAGLGTAAAWYQDGPTSPAMFGCAVKSAGDVNGDGYSDVIVGARLYTNGEAMEGGAFVYLGGGAGLAATPQATLQSNQAQAFMGGSVAGVGDVDGDGYGDVVVGAQSYTNGNAREGAAFLYRGSASGTATTHSWIGEANQDNAFYGCAVAAAGDINGDGYADVAIGASAYDAGETNEGVVFTYLGGAGGLSAQPNWTLRAEQGDARFGGSVASAGDVNGDGFSDLIVGAFQFDNPELNEGRAFMFYGSADGLPTAASWTAESNSIQAYMGFSVAAAGDVNGDGYGDVVVGARLYDNGQTDEGAAFVYLGGESGLAATAVRMYEGDQEYAYLGHSVSGAGDVNGDGYADIAVGAPSYDNGEQNEGVVLVYLGSSGGPAAAPSYTIDIDRAESMFGASVAGAGDVNGDGYADVVVGAPWYSNGQSKEGAAFLYLGAASGLTDIPSWSYESNQAGAELGAAVAAAGDVDGDGYGDLLVGAYAFDQGQMDEGIVYLFGGTAAGPASVPAWSAEGDQEAASFGASVASAGDVNGDGYTDVIIGAPFFDGGQNDEGIAMLYYGGSEGLATTAAWSMEGELGQAYFGSSVSSAGDINGDGYADLIVGAPDYTNGQNDEGRAFVYMGSSTGPVTGSAWTSESDQTSAHFGASVACAGDVNGDGFSDVIVGAYRYDAGQIDEGRASVFYGNSEGLPALPRQYQSDGSTPLAVGGVCSTEGEVVLALHARSFLGRQKGELVWEYRENGQPYTGEPVSRSVQASGEQASWTDLGMSGTALSAPVSVLEGARVYKWRVRVKYDPVTAITGQVYGPWRYMPNPYLFEAGVRTSNMSAPAAPELLSPRNAASGVSLPAALLWTSSARADSYVVHISSTADFSDTIAAYTGVTDTSLQANGLDTGTRYYWRVAGANAFGRGRPSLGWNFVTRLGVPSAPVLIRPANGDSVSTDSVHLEWHSSGGSVTEYWVEYAADSTMAGAIVDSTVTDTSFVLRSLADGTRYWWRVRARNTAGWGSYGEKRTFIASANTHVRMPQDFSIVTRGITGRGGMLRYGLPRDAFVRIRVYNLLGKELVSAVNRRQRAGYHTFALGSVRLAPGRYVLHFQAGDFRAKRPLTISR